MIHDVVLDPLSDAGWKHRRRVKGLVGSTDAEGELRIQTAPARRSYDVPFLQCDVPRWTGLADFHELRGGTTYGFLLWDLYRCHAVSQRIGTGDGATKSFQLSTTITDASASVTRPIRFPVTAGTVLPVNVAGVVKAYDAYTLTTATHAVTVNGVARADFTLARGTGLLTFTGVAPAAGAPILWSGFYHTPVRFQNDTWEMDMTSFLASSTPPLIEILGYEPVA